ncbi:MAG: MFS transporter [Chromatiaceae bacterium]
MTGGDIKGREAPAGYGRRAVLSWACYDWANSAFATVVIAGFFPIFFKQYWASGLAVTDSTFWLGMTNTLASALIVVCAPLLGAMADQLGAKKGFLLIFTALGVLGAGALYFVGQGQWGLALALYLCGLVGFSGSNIFYDALLVVVAAPAAYNRVSALGYALGYLGGGLLFALNVLMTLYPASFGFAGAQEAVHAAFLGVAIWWSLFTLPVAIWVPEADGHGDQPLGQAARDAFRELGRTLVEIRQRRDTFLFLLAYWFYIDGVDTIVHMAVDFGLAIGLAADGLMIALLITQFVGFPAALVFGWLGGRWGAKRGILLAIGIYALVVFLASGMTRVEEFYLLAVVIGLVQGGIQALSRALFAGFVPRGRAAEFFGFYNMLGKFAAVLGPGLVGVAALVTGDPRLSLLPILVLFLFGAGLLWRVRIPETGAAAPE